MWAWLKANPLYAGIILVVAVAIVAGAYKLIDKWHGEHENQLVNQGELQEHGKTNEETINAVNTAKNAVEQPSAEQLNRVCGKYDRNCKNGS